jgi:arginyl-tRNA synthetase
MDSYFNEHTLYETNAVWDALDALREKGVVYDADGAAWMKTTDFGKDKDTVLVKSSGEPTYRLPDIAYHADKLTREVNGKSGGFDLAVDVFGADHIATYPDVLKALEVLGHDPERVKVLVYQFVTLVRTDASGERHPVKMSTRKATYETLEDLMDEVGEDVVRFFFLMRAPGTHLEFDLGLAKEASEKNPVFYLQYAHARIASIRRKAAEVGVDEPEGGADLGLLTHEAEQALIKEILRLPEEIRLAAELMGPHRLATYLRDVAVAFSRFYDQCHIIGQDPALAGARLALARAAQTTVRNGLTILGIGAPERM